MCLGTARRLLGLEQSQWGGRGVKRGERIVVKRTIQKVQAGAEVVPSACALTIRSSQGAATRQKEAKRRWSPLPDGCGTAL